MAAPLGVDGEPEPSEDLHQLGARKAPDYWLEQAEAEPRELA